MMGEEAVDVFCSDNQTQESTTMNRMERLMRIHVDIQESALLRGLVVDHA